MNNDYHLHKNRLINVNTFPFKNKSTKYTMLFFRKAINKYEFKQLIDQFQKPEKELI